ncbi:hypothetical protein [Paracidovorax avenae]|uniref:hypothetical protein n=1 Tax=Paracidovorax avenae TaxID=80867 RepID=UPI0012FD28CD|nr:hypothetical protein [Paracidovorax avenae]
MPADHSRVNFSETVKILSEMIGLHMADLSDFQKFVEKQPGWRHMAGWMDMSDLQIFENFKLDAGLGNLIYFVNDVSYLDGRGAFEVSGEDVVRFVSGFLDVFGENLFNGDVLVACPDLSIIWAFHHDGWTIRADLP